MNRVNLNCHESHKLESFHFREISSDHLGEFFQRHTLWGENKQAAR